MGYYIGYKISNDSHKPRIVTVTRDDSKEMVRIDNVFEDKNECRLDEILKKLADINF